MLVYKGKFDIIKNPVDNFDKITYIESEKMFEGEIPKSPVISIIVITNQRLDLLLEAVESISAQQPVLYEWETIIMDNDPKSINFKEIEKYKDMCRMRYYRNTKNLGHEGNINRGVQLARGDWVALLHDDDLLMPYYLQHIIKYIDRGSKWKKPLAYIRTKHIKFIDGEDVCREQKSDKKEPICFVKKELWIETLLRGEGPTFVNSCGSILNKNAFIKIGGYNNILDPIADSTLGLIFMSNGYSVTNTEKEMGYYRQGRNLSSRVDTVVKLIEADYDLREYLYSTNLFCEFFGKIFRGIQFTISVNEKKELQEQCNNYLPIEYVNKIYTYRKRPIGCAFVRVLRNTLSIIYRPNKLLRKVHMF